MEHRPSRDETMLLVAHTIARRGTCRRRKVGCVLVNNRGHIKATGFNGVAPGLPHCIDDGHACIGASAQSGAALDQCQATHAEQNALLQCADVWALETCYATTSPCVTCVKLLLNTSVTRIVFSEEYSQPEAQALWLGADNGRTWSAVQMLRAS